MTHKTCKIFLYFLIIFNANFMLAMNKVYKVEKNSKGAIVFFFYSYTSKSWVTNENKQIEQIALNRYIGDHLTKKKACICVTSNEGNILAVRGYEHQSKKVYKIQKSTMPYYNSNNNLNVENDTTDQSSTLEDFLTKEALSINTPEDFITDNLNQTGTPKNKPFNTNPTSNKKNNFKLPEFITSLQPRSGLLDEIKEQMTQYPKRPLSDADRSKTYQKPLHLSVFTEAVLSSAVKNYLLDKWVASINEDDIFFTLATALQKSNSNLSIFGFKGALAVISLQYKPKLLQDNNFYLRHYGGKTKKFAYQCCPPSAIQQILATQLLGLAYQTIAPKEYQDGWFAGPIGQFVFEQAAITAAKTNRYGVWSLIGAELIQGYVPNITGTTLEKQLKKIVVHQARTSTFLQALRDLHIKKDAHPVQHASHTILKLLAKTAITAVPHCAYHQTPLKKKLKKLKKTNPTFASSIKLIGRYGVPFAADMLFERFTN